MKDQATLSSEIQGIFNWANTSDETTAQIQGFMITIHNTHQASYEVCLEGNGKRHHFKIIRYMEGSLRIASDMMAAIILTA